MTIEIPNPPDFIDDLDPTYPASGDSRTEGDDHIRNIKTAITNTFTGITGEVSATHTELNYLDGPSPGTNQASKVPILDANADLHLQSIGGDIDCVNLTATGTSTITTADINGGAIDGTTIGASSTSTVACTTITASSTADFNGNVDLGGSSSNTISFIGDVDTHILPSGNTQDLGASGSQWRNLYVDGTGNIDILALSAGTTVNDIDTAMAGSPTDNQLLTAQGIKEYADSVGYHVAVRESVSGSSSKTTTGFSGTIDQISIAMENLTVSSSGAFISIKIGDSGGIESSGYRGFIGQHDGRSAMGGGSGSARDGAYFNINENSMGTADIAEGVITLSRCNGNVWALSYSGFMHDNGSYTSWIVGGGSKSLSGALDRVQIATTAGTFSSGSWKVSYTRSA